MAIQGMYPKSGPRPTSSHAERRIHAALSRPLALPTGMVGWHALAFTHDRRELELDFVIAHPDRGLVVVEAKGGQITVEDGFWHQNGARMAESPPTQATGAAHALARWLKKELGPLDFPPFTYALWFPDMSDPPIRAGDAVGRMLGAEALTWTSDAIVSLCERLLPSRTPPKPFVHLLHHLWGESSPPSPVRLGTKIEQARFDRLRLDASQRELFDAVSDNPRLLVQGGAGTGKTQLAVRAARERAERGERVLLTCFTEGLARCLADACGGSPHVEVGTIRELAVKLAREAGEVRRSAPPPDWEEVALDGGVAVLDGAGRWDAVILDEAQDLTANDWEFVRACAGEGPLLAFADLSQAFWPDRAIPREALGLMSVRLREGHRVPQRLLALAEAFAHDEDVRDHADAARFDALEVVTAPREGVTRALEKTLRRVLSERVAPRDVAIVSLRGQTVPGGAAALERVGDVSVVRVSDPSARDHVVADTFLRFKGLERPVIIVADLDLVEERLGVRMHIALTRTLTRAIVVASKERAAEVGLE
jgi:hypothetical protein